MLGGGGGGGGGELGRKVKWSYMSIITLHGEKKKWRGTRMSQNISVADSPKM